MGFKDAALPMKERALATAIGQEMRLALAEHRAIESGLISDPFFPVGPEAHRLRERLAGA